MLLFFTAFSLLFLLSCAYRLRQVVAAIPALSPSPSENQSLSSHPPVAIIVPAYNEADNIATCLEAILESARFYPGSTSIWMVDDQSTDSTWTIAQTVQNSLTETDPPLHLVAGQDRPSDEIWVGKNWACAQAIDQQTAADHDSTYLLFVDADVRLEPEAIAAAIAQADTEAIDLLTCCPAIQCGCLAEWLVQPIIFTVILIGFDIRAVNDSKSESAFAAGPFMLFRRTAYDKIGGHRAVASEVVEDVELARRIKGAGLQLQFLAGASLISVRMYRSWADLWEGWTKNIYAGAQRNLFGTLSLAVMVLLLCTLPWLLLGGLGIKALLLDWDKWDGLILALLGLALMAQVDLRRIGGRASGMTARYWWLSGLGGLAVAAIALASIIKTETGWGWTWRGRPLQTVHQNPLD
ncbi:glycosyltransferase [filamentous cyanobacterium LEGE 07170]|nr:glycosyltransferase [filamentous cyanobacterium LEGE 07170]